VDFVPALSCSCIIHDGELSLFCNTCGCSSTGARVTSPVVLADPFAHHRISGRLTGGISTVRDCSTTSIRLLINRPEHRSWPDLCCR
jgi:hypothetical protein